MARTQLDRLFAQVAEIAERIGESDDSLSSAEVTNLLSCAGYEDDELRRALRDNLKDLAMRLRRSGQLVPPYLSRVIESVSTLEVLAAKQPAAALSRVRQSLKALAEAAGRVASLAGDSIQVSHAYRKTRELSPRDSTLLDELESELKSRVRGQQGDEQDGK